MLISAVIPTYNREDKLARAVSSVLQQELEDAAIEVIVVNDAENTLKFAVWQTDPRVSIFNTNHTERAVARNTGAALSKGDYIAFLDDDDERLPGAFSAMMKKANETNADWIYGSYEEVTDEGEHIRICRPVVRGNIFALVIAGAAIPVQASLIKRETFFRVGGFDNRFYAEEDTELLQRISMNGVVEVTSHVVTRIRVGPHGATTTNWTKVPYYGRLKREKIFAEPDCINAIKNSLKEWGSPDTIGKICRYYLGSSARHTKNLALLTALSRFIVSVRFAFPSLLFPKFWRGFLSVD